MLKFLLQPEKVEFDLKLGQSKPIYNAFKAIRESPDWAGLSDAQKRIVECKYVQVLLIVREQWLFYCAYQLSLQVYCVQLINVCMIMM